MPDLREPVFGVKVPRNWLRLLYIGYPLPLWVSDPQAPVSPDVPSGYVRGWPGGFLFWPQAVAGHSLVAGVALEFPPGITCAFWQGSKREAICPPRKRRKAPG